MRTPSARVCGPATPPDPDRIPATAARRGGGVTSALARTATWANSKAMYPPPQRGDAGQRLQVQKASPG